MSETAGYILLGFAGAFGIGAVIVSILLLQRGKLYHRLSPEARPRRWVLISLLFLFVVFLVWFPIWIIWPKLLISRFLTLLFAITFAAVGLSLKWLGGLIGWLVERKGRQLR